MSLFVWLLLAYWLFGTIATIAWIGKQRTPLTPGVAVVTVLVNVAWTVGLLVHEGVL